MISLTRTEYRKVFGGSRQSIAARIKRGSLKTSTEKRRVEIILIDDTDENRVKVKALTA